MRELLLLFLCCLFEYTLSHISLTFPEARYPPLDFLDTSRTMGPCGVPKPKLPHYTSLVVGNTYNFTWAMPYPHQGGFRLTLLDSEGKLVEQLSPMNGLEFAGSNEIIALSERIHFTKPCHECTVLLERQALEWGKSYRFRSCADVNIIQSANDESTCSGRGLMENGACSCDHGYTGDICQYNAHCERDSDCMNGGKCVTEKNNLVAKMCYCSYGFFGRNCEQNFNRDDDSCFAYSQPNEKSYENYGMFNSNCYNKEHFNDDDYVYFRKVKNDVEIILDFSTTSWVSLGWRPEGLDPSCRLFPDLEGVRSKRSSIDTPPLVAQLDEPMPSSVQRDEPPHRIAQEGPRPKMPKNNGLLSSAFKAPLHAMDCIDIIVGSVKYGRLRIMDMYSRDRSTPLEDSWYEGEMSLVAAYGAERDGRTIVMFRRMVQEIEPTDHPLGPGRMFVAWAKGQTQGAYAHSAASALEHMKSDVEYYPDDMLKYHGSKNRGVHPIDFTTPVKMLKPSDPAFGVNIAKGEDVLKHSTEEEVNEEKKESEEPDSSNTNQFIMILMSICIAFHL